MLPFKNIFTAVKVFCLLPIIMIGHFSYGQNEFHPVKEYTLTINNEMVNLAGKDNKWRYSWTYASFHGR